MPIVLFLVVSVSSCSLFDPEEPLPIYLNIDSITVDTDYQNEGTASSKVTDAWVYVNDNPVGAFELPAAIPILASGETNIKVFPGIKNSGITEFRKRYLPYTAYEQDTTLKEGTSFSLNPVLSYDDNLIFAWLEDFEDISISVDSIYPSETKIRRTTTYLKERSGSGLIELNSSFPRVFKGVNSTLLNLPRQGQDTYLELDYLCNQEFIVGLRAFGQQSLQDNDLVTITPTNKDGVLKWNKLYIEMTDMLQNTNLAVGHQVYIQALYDSTLTEDGIIALDNLKVLHVPWTRNYKL